MLFFVYSSFPGMGFRRYLYALPYPLMRGGQLRQEVSPAPPLPHSFKLLGSGKGQDVGMLREGWAGGSLSMLANCQGVLTGALGDCKGFVGYPLKRVQRV